MSDPIAQNKMSKHLGVKKEKSCFIFVGLHCFGFETNKLTKLLALYTKTRVNKKNSAQKLTCLILSPQPPSFLGMKVLSLFDSLANISVSGSNAGQ